jgi:hypothetical protein
MNILVLCTGNSARSEMTEGWFHHLAPMLEVEAAGFKPKGINPLAKAWFNTDLIRNWACPDCCPRNQYWVQSAILIDSSTSQRSFLGSTRWSVR